MELLEVGIFLFELCIGEFVYCIFLRDLGFENGALSKKFAVLCVAILFEARDHLFFLASVQCDRFQDHGFAPHLGDVVFEHLQPTNVIVGLGQQADAILQIDPSHALQPPPQSDPLRSRL